MFYDAGASVGVEGGAQLAAGIGACFYGFAGDGEAGAEGGKAVEGRVTTAVLEARTYVSDAVSGGEVGCIDVEGPTRGERKGGGGGYGEGVDAKGVVTGDSPGATEQEELGAHGLSGEGC